MALLPCSAAAIEYKIFANMDYLASSLPTQPGGFVQGTMDFFATHSIDPRTDSLAEVTVHPHKTGLAGIDLERLQVGYLFHDSLRLWVGRFHNLLGYWNLAYHHGMLLHTTVDRPDFLKWEHDGGFLPTHFNGVWAEGRVPAGPAKLRYGVMVGNGSQIITTGMQANNIGDDNSNKAVSFNLTASLRDLPFTGAGLSGNFSRIMERGAGSILRSETSQKILGAHLFHTQAPFELIAEYYNVRDDAVGVSSSKGSHTSHAYFVQGGYGLKEKVIPYIRYERVAAVGESVYVTALKRNAIPQAPLAGVTPSAQDHFKYLLGIRYNLGVHSAVKLEWRYIRAPGTTSGHPIFREVAAQWAFSF